MDDQNFDNFLKSRLEAFRDRSLVDEAALTDVLAIAEQINPATNWWEQWFRGGGWMPGSLSLLIVGGVLWWTVGTKAGTSINEPETPTAFVESQWPEKRQQMEELPEELVEAKRHEEGLSKSRMVEEATPPALTQEVAFREPRTESWIVVFSLERETAPLISLTQIKAPNVHPIPFSYPSHQLAEKDTTIYRHPRFSRRW